MALTFGPRTHSTEFDPNLFQGQEPTCAIRSQEIVMRDFGIQIPQEELVKYATEHGWYDDGTPFECMSNLLNTVHIDTHTQENVSVDDLACELNAGHRVIVAVDAHEIWRDHGPIGNWIADHFVDANHALIVTSLNVDLEDSSKSTVLLTDPGSGEIIECPYDRFLHSWGDSGRYMIATDDAAPYQYNPDTQDMEFSGFATNYTMPEFHLNNEFSSIYDIATQGDYNPIYGLGDTFNFANNGGDIDCITSYYDHDFLNLDDIDKASLSNDEIDEICQAHRGMVGHTVDDVEWLEKMVEHSHGLEQQQWLEKLEYAQK